MVNENFIEQVLKIVEELNCNDRMPNFSDLGEDVNLTLPTEKRRDYEGMQMNYYADSKLYEVSEYMAGKNEDELHIFTKTTSLKIALKSLYKGNKKRKIIERW